MFLLVRILKKNCQFETVKLTLHLGEPGSLSLADLTFVFEIGLVADKDDSDFLISVITHLLQPLTYRLKGRPTRDIVYK